MTTRWLLRIGSRSTRRLAKPGTAAARVADVTYCESEACWAGLPAAAARALRAQLDAREPCFLALDLHERVAYAGLLGAALMIEAGHATEVFVLPLDWVVDAEREPHCFDGSERAVAFSDGPVLQVRSATLARSLADRTDVRVRAGEADALDGTMLAALHQGEVGGFRQRLLLTGDNAGCWDEADAYDVARAFAQAESPQVFTFDPRAPLEPPPAAHNPLLRTRLANALRAKLAVDDPLAGTADPLSGAEQHLLRRYVVEAPLGDAKQGWQDGFAQWMVCKEPGANQLPRLEHEIYRHRRDLQGRFALPWMRAHAMRSWLIRRGLADLRIALLRHDDVALPPWWRRTRERSAQPRRPCDVHVVGYLDSAIGLGTSGRNHRDALELAGLSTAATVIPARGRTHPIAPRTPSRCHATLFIVNGRWLDSAMAYVESAAVEQTHRIGLWAWETPQVPRAYLKGLEYVDEIWTPSAFVRDAFRTCTDKPVHVVPHPVRVVAGDKATPAFEAVRPKAPYLFFAFDYDARAVRKNPEGLIGAFTCAFAPGAGPHLLIKTRNALSNRKEHEALLRAARGRSDIHIVDATWPAGLMEEALRNSLGVVSLHRSEGFGLLLAEAMACGKPTIATGYSGNLEFQDEGNALLVRYTMTRLRQDCGPFEAGQPWAEPDIDDAARALRVLYEGGEAVQALAWRGAQTVRERLAPQVIGARMKALLEAHLTRRSEAPAAPLARRQGSARGSAAG